MQILENISLKSYNTFHIEAIARYFVEVTSVQEIREILNDSRFLHLPRFILGGGSNLLFVGDFDGLVIKVNLKGIEQVGHPEFISGSQTNTEMLKQVQHDETKIYIKAMAGENWHEFVRYTLDKGWYGLENLSLIPGTVGAAPIQNIGAYGVEVGEIIESVEWLDFDTGNIREFTREECTFGYRESIFKSKLKGKGVVLSVTFRLTTMSTLKLEYGAIAAELSLRGITNPTPKDVSDVVISIRKSKLPNPEEIGNAGSFFKNPYVCLEHFQALKKKYPNIPSYPTENPNVLKIAAGWLIEQAGWKGKRVDDAGVHENQALVLVNYGEATGEDILTLSQNILEDVMNKFGVKLEREVSILGDSIDKK